MKIALDTNRYGDFVQGDASAEQAIQAAVEIYIPFIVLAELRSGFAGGRRGRDNEAILARVLRSARVNLLFPDDTTTRHYAALYQQLRRQGTPMPTNDLWIAALVIQHDLQLMTRDRHFDHLPQVRRI